MLLDMLSLSRVRSISLYRSDKDFGYALRMDAAPEAMRLSKGRMRKRDGCRSGGCGPWEFFEMLVFLLLAGARKGERGYKSKRKDLSRNR